MIGTEIESARTALQKSVLYLSSGFEFITAFDQPILKDRKFVTEKD